MKNGVLGLFCLILTAFPTSPVWAHGGVSIEKDLCVRTAGLYLIHFAAYQPQFNPSREYCADVPKAGNTILVFDLVDLELRSRPLAVRVIEAGNVTEPRTVLYVPAKTYSTGVVNAEANFDLPGKYTAIVTLEGSNHTINFPIRVALGSNRLVLFISVLLVGSALGYSMVGRRKGWPLPSGQKRTAKLRLVKG
jgi:hypothetical protein